MQQVPCRVRASCPRLASEMTKSTERARAIERGGHRRNAREPDEDLLKGDAQDLEQGQANHQIGEVFSVKCDWAIAQAGRLPALLVECFRNSRASSHRCSHGAAAHGSAPGNCNARSAGRRR